MEILSHVIEFGRLILLQFADATRIPSLRIAAPHPARLDGANDGVLFGTGTCRESDPIRLVRMVKKIMGRARHDI